MFQRNHFTEEDHFFLLVKETWEDHIVWNKPLQWFLAQLFINILPESLKTNNFARHAVNKKE